MSRDDSQRRTELSPLERLSLATQFRILKAVDPDYADFHHLESLIEILEGGYEAEYPRIIGRFGENRLSVEECQLVGDVLLMHSWILDHAGKTSADLSQFQHVEFDSNTETDHLSYARFLYEWNDGERGYPGVKGVVNSHHSTLYRHRTMVAAWHESKRRAGLTEADVVRIIAAGGGLTADRGDSGS